VAWVVNCALPMLTEPCTC